MKLTSRLLTLGILALALGACSSGDISKTDSGGVTLSISDFDGLPITVSASAASYPTFIESLTISNVAIDPSGTTSDLMNVEIQGIQVTYSRGDRGTRLPPSFIEYFFGVVPVNGTLVRINMPILKANQFTSVPIKDLLDFGVDTETNSRIVVLNVTLKAFGRTLAGKNVESNPATFTIEIRP